jgi:hypothetical protein
MGNVGGIGPQGLTGPEGLTGPQGPQGLTGPQGHGYVDRGDPAGWDFDITNFPTAWIWTELNLSSIVPAGAIAVHILVSCRTTVANEEIMFRKNGNIHETNMSECRPQVANLYDVGEFIVSLSSDRKIDYNKYGTHFDSISVVVKGWWV